MTPKLAAEFSEGIAILERDKGSGNLRERDFLQGERIFDFFVWRGGILFLEVVGVEEGDHLHREPLYRVRPRWRSFTGEKSHVGEPLLCAAACVTDDALLVASEGLIVAFSPSLEETGRVAVVESYLKDAHDLLGSGSRAWALDNIVHPIWVVALRTDETAALTVSARTEIHDVNHHLVAQYVDEASGLWTILQSSTHRGGKTLSLRVLSSNSGKDLGGRELDHRGWTDGPAPRPDLAFDSRIEVWKRGQDRYDPVGLRILSATTVLPAWVLIGSGGLPEPDGRPDTFHAARFEVRNGRLELGRFVLLPPELGAGRPGMIEHEGRVLVLGETGNEEGSTALHSFDPVRGGELRPVEVQLTSRAGQFFGKVVPFTR